MIESKARDIMSKARTRLVTGYPFFGNQAMKLKLIEDESVNTMATDGRVVKFNPNFVEELPLVEVVGVLAHEILHVTNGHHLRQNHGQEREHLLLECRL
jgi:predicted Zn-dependent protease